MEDQQQNSLVSSEEGPLNEIKLKKNEEVDTNKDKGLSPWKTIGVCFLTYLIYGCLSSYVFDWHVNDISMYVCSIISLLLMLSYAGKQLTWREQNGKTFMSLIALIVAYGWSFLFCVSIYKNLHALFTGEY